ncbi:type II and III secretion system protein family protein [Janthinobacterium violaceinigrum]|uniref:Type II and III secretion system protein family protein n=1 Tax=Janthinobacterium violaceinigrum TaxID=2654252 RepID=A0A6I1HJG4_9BURK|nr:type II and III secretion system protein family protein [Janthinobacterium violaceinigrum]KAB8058200.1 type II and III secretion system protein family protein [Janthinobacterium violaceinigrum]
MTSFRTHIARPRLSLALALGGLAASLLWPCGAGAAPPLRKADGAGKVAEAAAPLSLGADIARLGPPIRLSVGKSTLRSLTRAVSQIAVNDPKVAGARLLGSSSELYIWGLAPGSTNLILWDKDHRPVIVDIEVGVDADGLQAQLAHVFPRETDLKASSAGGAIVLTGMVSDAVKASQIVAMATAFAQRGGGEGATPAGAGLAVGAPAPGPAGGAGVSVIDMLTVAAPQQVMLEVKIAEVSKTLVDQLGASIGARASSGNWTYSFLSNLLSGNPSMIDGFNGKNGNFLTLDAQKRDGLVKVLAEPNIMAISGQEASFLAGGKIYIPVSQDSATNKITLEEKEFGIAVKFTPTVLDGGRINLKVAPEVSELNKDGIGITTGGTAGSAILPAFTTRRATTTVQLFDGQSFAIGGLIKNNVTTNIKALPMLGEIPVLGALFRSSDFQTDRTELVFIITPHLVKPLAGDYALPTDAYVAPSRAQFFLQGKMEGTPKAPPAAGTQPGAAAATGFDIQ